jgi:hypothetical protein
MVDELAQETISPRMSNSAPPPDTPQLVDGDAEAMDVAAAENGSSSSSSTPAPNSASGLTAEAEASLARDQRIAASSNAATKRGRAGRKHFNDRFADSTTKFRLTGYVNENGTATDAPAAPPPEFVVHEFATRPPGALQHQPPPYQGTLQVQPQPPPRAPVQYAPPYDPNAQPTRRRRMTGPDEWGSMRPSPFTYNPAVPRASSTYGPGPYDPPDSAYEWGGNQPPYPPQGPPPGYAHVHGHGNGHGPPPDPHRSNSYHPQGGPGPSQHYRHTGGGGGGGGPNGPPGPPNGGGAGPGGGRDGSRDGGSPPPGDRPQTGGERGPYRMRVVNVLIKDERGDSVEEEYAEIKAPIAQADELGPNSGYWVDAKSVVEALQAGPGRIDGPAKVYTMRGRFKQVFLRVSADNVDQAVSANLLTTPRRVLEVTVVPVGIRSICPSRNTSRTDKASSSRRSRKDLAPAAQGLSRCRLVGRLRSHHPQWEIPTRTPAFLIRLRPRPAVQLRPTMQHHPRVRHHASALRRKTGI